MHLHQVESHLAKLKQTVTRMCQDSQQQNKLIWPNMVRTVLNFIPTVQPSQIEQQQQQTERHGLMGGLRKSVKGGSTHAVASPSSDDPPALSQLPRPSGVLSVTSLKLTRFPAVIDAIVEQASRLTDERSVTLAVEVAQCIDYHFCIPGQSLGVDYDTHLAANQAEEDHADPTISATKQMEHDLAAFDRAGQQRGQDRASSCNMQVQLLIATKRIKNDLLHLFAKHSMWTGDLHKSLRIIVPEFLTAETQEACHAERAIINAKLQRVHRAIHSISGLLGASVERPIPVARKPLTKIEEVRVGDLVDYRSKTSKSWARVAVIGLETDKDGKMMITIERSNGVRKCFELTPAIKAGKMRLPQTQAACDASGRLHGAAAR